MKKKYDIDQVDAWLFGNNHDRNFPPSQLHSRNKVSYQPKMDSNNLSSIGEGPCTSRIRIHAGGITDIQIEEGKRGAIATSNNGDLLTGCGYAVAKAVINAAGAGLQTELYNRFGVPGVMEVGQVEGESDTKTSEGRGHAITCDSYEMKDSHHIERIEMLTVPMYDGPGVENMYYEALVHSKDLDYILFPMAGMTHPVVGNNSNKSAEFSLNAVAQFMKDFPDSKLQVIFTIFNDPIAEENYIRHALVKDEELALFMAANPQPSVVSDVSVTKDSGPVAAIAAQKSIKTGGKDSSAGVAAAADIMKYFKAQNEKPNEQAPAETSSMKKP